MNKRKIFISILTLALAIPILLFIYVWRIEPRWVEWNYLEMSIKNLPESLVDKKLIQVSDIHIGETVEVAYIINQFKKIDKANADILVYTGDFISPVRIDQAPFDQLEEALKHISKGKLATIAILGNHDYGILAKNGPRADSLVSILEKHQIKVLRNSNESVDGLNIIGIDDMWGTNFNPFKAMSYYDKNGANLILCHNPDACDLPIWNHYEGWILAGHTHGGQVRFPFQKATRIPVDNKNYDEGLKQLQDGRTLYVNKGLGHSIRIRWNVRPEIAVFTLKKKG